jgi:autotransporter-associated beta strand protein
VADVGLVRRGTSTLTFTGISTHAGVTSIEGGTVAITGTHGYLSMTQPGTTIAGTTATRLP